MCELEIDRIQPMQPLFAEPSLFPILSALDSYPGLPAFSLTPLESERFPTLKGKPNGITTF
jgi:hypothetical protein